MLIMPSTDINFQALAENIAADFFGKGVPLADGIVKTAKEHDFTPEEVKRLLEKTNTQASIHLLKTADDKKASFTLAHLDLVLRQTHPGEEVIQKTASYRGLPFTNVKPCPESIEKIAYCLTPQAPTQSQKSLDAQDCYGVVCERLEKASLEKIAAEETAKKSMDKLCHIFDHRRDRDFSKFAADACEMYGKYAVAPIVSLARYLNEPIVKTASSEIIDDSSDEMREMEKLCESLYTIEKQASVIDSLSKIKKSIYAGLLRSQR